MSGDLVITGHTGGAFSQNGYLARCARTNHAILVDPGAAVGEMLQAAREADATIDLIVLTHAHLDHVEGVPEAKAETGAPILLHPDDALLYEQVPAQAGWFGMPPLTMPPVDRAISVDQPLEFGDCQLEVRHAPGHAPGHVILVGDGEALVADTLFAGSIGRTDLPGGDAQLLLRSIREQILTLPDETVLHTGHGPSTTVGHERATNPFLTEQYGGSSFA